MITARDIMSTDLITADPDMEITKATRLLLDNRINGLPVVNDAGKLVGILCQSDIISQQKKLPIPSIFSLLDGFIPITSIKRIEKEAQKIAATTVSHAMTPNPVSIKPDTGIQAVAARMVDRRSCWSFLCLAASASLMYTQPGRKLPSASAMARATR